MSAGKEKVSVGDLAMTRSNHNSSPSLKKVVWKACTHDIPSKCWDALKQYHQLALGVHSESAPEGVINPPTWNTQMTWREFVYLPLRLAFHRTALKCRWTYKMAIRISGGIDPRVFKPCSAGLTCAICKHYVACKNYEYDGLAEVPDELMHNFIKETLTPEVLRERGHLLGG